jgi:hypothetical protein
MCAAAAGRPATSAGMKRTMKEWTMIIVVMPASYPAGVADYSIFPVCNKAKLSEKKPCRIVFTNGEA